MLLCMTSVELQSDFELFLHSAYSGQSGRQVFGEISGGNVTGTGSVLVPWQGEYLRQLRDRKNAVVTSFSRERNLSLKGSVGVSGVGLTSYQNAGPDQNLVGRLRRLSDPEEVQEGAASALVEALWLTWLSLHSVRGPALARHFVSHPDRGPVPPHL